MDFDDDFIYEEDRMGMTITSGNVVIQKDSSNLIGISIGGGAPLCPCLYIVQIFDNTPAAAAGVLEAGDELVSINGQVLKGKTKVEVAKLIQSCEENVSINYNKLHADLQQGQTLDIILKKVKHRFVESMGSATADALGLSRAILCNDTLVQRLTALEKTEYLYKGLVAHARSTLHSFFDLFQIYKILGDAFASMGVKEPQPSASEAFTKFGELHRQIEKVGIQMLKTIKPILHDLGTYLNKAIPDTRMTISKYADSKFEYLSYCLKVKEMDDEEQSYLAIQEPLYRIETGNYEYRLILRCRQNARAKFAKLRADVMVKLELLDNKHVDDIVTQLKKFSAGLADYYTTMTKLLSENIIFPVEIDLSQSAFQTQCSDQAIPPYEDEEDNDTREVELNKSAVLDNAEEAIPFSGPTDLESNNHKPISLISLNDGLEEVNLKEIDNLLEMGNLNLQDASNDEFEQLLCLVDSKHNSPPELNNESDLIESTVTKGDEDSNSKPNLTNDDLIPKTTDSLLFFETNEEVLINITE